MCYNSIQQLKLKGTFFMPEQILVQFSIDKDKLSEHAISRADAWHAFEELRKQAANVPEMSLDEINAEISAARDERRRRT